MFPSGRLHRRLPWSFREQHLSTGCIQPRQAQGWIGLPGAKAITLASKSTCYIMYEPPRLFYDSILISRIYSSKPRRPLLMGNGQRNFSNILWNRSGFSFLPLRSALLVKYTDNLGQFRSCHGSKSIIPYRFFFSTLDSRLWSMMVSREHTSTSSMISSTLSLFIWLLSGWYIRFLEQSTVTPRLTLPWSAGSRSRTRRIPEGCTLGRSFGPFFICMYREALSLVIPLSLRWWTSDRLDMESFGDLEHEFALHYAAKQTANIIMWLPLVAKLVVEVTPHVATVRFHLTRWIPFFSDIDSSQNIITRVISKPCS